MIDALPAGVQLHIFFFAIETKHELFTLIQLSRQCNAIIADIVALLELDARDRLLRTWVEEHLGDDAVLIAFSKLSTSRTTGVCEASQPYIVTVYGSLFPAREVLFKLVRNPVRYKALLPFATHLFQQPAPIGGDHFMLGDEQLNFEEYRNLQVTFDYYVMDYYRRHWFSRDTVDALNELYPLHRNYEVYLVLPIKDRFLETVIPRIIFAKSYQQYIDFPHLYRQRISFRFRKYYFYSQDVQNLKAEQIRNLAQFAIDNDIILLLFHLVGGNIIVRRLVWAVVEVNMFLPEIPNWLCLLHVQLHHHPHCVQSQVHCGSTNELARKFVGVLISLSNMRC